MALRICWLCSSVLNQTFPGFLASTKNLGMIKVCAWCCWIKLLLASSLLGPPVLNVWEKDLSVGKISQHAPNSIPGIRSRVVGSGPEDRKIDGVRNIEYILATCASRTCNVLALEPVGQSAHGDSALEPFGISAPELDTYRTQHVQWVSSFR